MTTVNPEQFDAEQLIDLPTLARWLGVTERHIRRLVAERRIPFHKWGLCGIPHRPQYVAAAVMWRDGMLARSCCGSAVRGVRIFTGLRGTRGAGRVAGNGRRACRVVWSGRGLVLSCRDRHGDRSGSFARSRGRARAR